MSNSSKLSATYHQPCPTQPGNNSTPARATLMGLLFAAMALFAGCQDPELDFNLSDLKSDAFEPKKPPRECMLVATSESDADTRREALVRVARSGEFTEPWAVDGYVTVALLDTDSQTRCVAIRALERVGNDRAIEALLKILSATAETAQTVRPASDVCRADAALSVSRLLDRGTVSDENRAAAGRALRPLVKVDAHAAVRRAAARGLGFVRERENLDVLIAGLRDAEFNVVYECEESLVRLTGVTHRTNVTDWETWLAQNAENPFVNAGHVPDSRHKPYDGPFGKTAHDMKQTWDWLFPAAAEE
ncbi:MAG: hypothetical protein JNG88_09980 [Phycisphaerales bacterium]|nr:hypothetical protein [Phycisphaerales bacterium]